MLSPNWSSTSSSCICLLSILGNGHTQSNHYTVILSGQTTISKCFWHCRGWFICPDKQSNLAGGRYGFRTTMANFADMCPGSDRRKLQMTYNFGNHLSSLFWVTETNVTLFKIRMYGPILNPNSVRVVNIFYWYSIYAPAGYIAWTLLT